MPKPASTASAVAHPNIAFIKYWGNRDDAQRLPSNGSLSMTLGGLETRTEVAFRPDLAHDRVVLNDDALEGEPADRIRQHLDRVRSMADVRDRAIVRSSSNFPSGAGIASSAAGFAALTVAACAAAGLGLDRRALSRLARTASGSAARSIFGGFVEWHAGNDLESYAESIAGQDHWNLVDLIAIVDSGEKAVGSSQGHRLADSSPFQAARVAGADDRLARCKRAILNRDFDSLAGVSELDSDMMHAVMMTSDPPLLYWLPGTIAIMRLARRLRSNGTRVFYTIDAGPNVHCICTADDAASVAAAIRRVPEVQQVLRATAGGPADRLGGR